MLPVLHACQHELFSNIPKDECQIITVYYLTILDTRISWDKDMFKLKF